MKIRYKKSRQNFNLIFALIWATIGVGCLIYGERHHWHDYGFIAISLLYLGRYLYECIHQYLIIEGDVLKVNSLISKKIKLSEITEIKKFAYDYTLKTDHSELTINTEIIDKKSLVDLKKILSKVVLPPNKTPFPKKY